MARSWSSAVRPVARAGTQILANRQDTGLDCAKPFLRSHGAGKWHLAGPPPNSRRPYAVGMPTWSDPTLESPGEASESEIGSKISPEDEAPSLRRRRVEAVLLLAKSPLTPHKLAQLSQISDATEARTLVRDLNAVYQGLGRALRIEPIAGGYRMMTRSELAPWLARLAHVPSTIRLSTPMMETLAIVAYRGPLPRAGVEAVRGVACGELLRQLMERDLVRIAGRSEELGRPYLYGTTKRFLQLFGLQNSEALPPIQWQMLQDDEPQDSTPKQEPVVSHPVVSVPHTETEATDPILVASAAAGTAVADLAENPRAENPRAEDPSAEGPNAEGPNAAIEDEDDDLDEDVTDDDDDDWDDDDWDEEEEGDDEEEAEDKEEADDELEDDWEEVDDDSDETDDEEDDDEESEGDDNLEEDDIDDDEEDWDDDDTEEESDDAEDEEWG